MKRFILLYLLYMILAFILVDYQPVREALMLDFYYTNVVVNISTWLIKFIGINVNSQGAFLYLSSAVMEVKFGCNGLEAILLYVSAVLAFPTVIKNRIIGIIAGSTILQILNIIRITILAWVLEFQPNIFPIMHEYITQSIMIALSFIIFIIYLQMVSYDKSKLS